MERHVPELYDWVKNNNEAARVMRCAILDVVSWFLGVLQQLWIDVSVRCPHAERYNESASKPGVAAIAGEAEKTKRLVRPCDRWSSRLMEDWAARAPSCCVIWWQRRRRTDVQPACCRTVEDPAGASAAVCTSRDILASGGIQSCGATCC